MTDTIHDDINVLKYLCRIAKRNAETSPQGAQGHSAKDAEALSRIIDILEPLKDLTHDQIRDIVNWNENMGGRKSYQAVVTLFSKVIL